MILLEAAIESLEAALAAADGGVHRIELCTDLTNGGTTPNIQLIHDCRSHLLTPIFVLVRPRPGDFVYTTAEHRSMIEQVHRAKQAGAHGIVTGALTDARQIAETRTAELIDVARPLYVTFHRAFDVCVDQAAALERLVRLGVDRVLTSGAAPTAPEGMERIRELVTQANGRIEILAGGGISGDNVARLVRETGVREVHFSVTDVAKVTGVVRALAES